MRKMNISAAFFAAFFFYSVISFAVEINPNHGILTQSTKDWLIDSENDILWLSGEKGISRVVRWENSPKVLNRKTTVSVNALIQLDKDNLIVGTNGKGLFRFHKHNFKMTPIFESELGSAKILCASALNNGTFTIGTESGVYQVNINTNSVNQTIKGSAGKVAYFNGKQYLLLSTSEGAKTINTQTWTSINSFEIENNGHKFVLSDGHLEINGQLYSSEDGLLEGRILDLLERNSQVVVVYANGYQIFDGETGQFGPLSASFKDWNFMVQKDGHQVLVEGNSTKIDEGLSVAKQEIPAELKPTKIYVNDQLQSATEVDLTYEDYEYTFQADLTGFTNATSFAYQINEGDWVSSEPNFKLEGLGHGDFKVAIKACNKFGYCITQEAFQFHVDHPLKKGWIIYATYLLIGIIFTGIVIFLTSVKYRKKIAVLEEAVLDKQREINQLKGNG